MLINYLNKRLSNGQTIHLATAFSAKVEKGDKRLLEMSGQRNMLKKVGIGPDKETC